MQCEMKKKRVQCTIRSGEKKLVTSYFCNILVSTSAFHPIAIFWGWLSFSDKKYAWLFHWKPRPPPSRLPNAMASGGGSLARHRMMMVAPIIVMAKEYDGIGALLQVSFLSKMQVSLSYYLIGCPRFYFTSQSQVLRDVWIWRSKGRGI